MEREDRNQRPARLAMAGLSLCMLMPALATSIANVGLPTLAEAFGGSFQAVQWVVLAYLLAVTALIVSAGKLGDVVGHRRLLSAGVGLFTLASLLCGLAPTLWLLVAARAAQGLGAAVMMALAMALVNETVPPAKTGAAMGLLGTMSAIGTTLGPSLGGLLIAGLGWPAIFLINVPFGLLGLLLILRMPAGASRKRDRSVFDAAGTLLLVATLVAYALAMTIGRGTFGAVNWILLGAALLGLGLFVSAETANKAPLLRLAMFRDPMLSGGLATCALVSTVLMATLVVGPFYLARGLALDPAGVGLVMSVGPLVAALGGVPAGRIVDRFGAERTTLVGLGGVFVGVLALAMAPQRFGVAGYIASMVLLTAHYALFQAANNTAVMTGVGSDRRGVVSGMLNLSRNLGLITGASAMGAVFAFGAGATDMTTAPPQAVAAGMSVTFIVAAGLILGALVIAIRWRARPRHALGQGS